MNYKVYQATKISKNRYEFKELQAAVSTSYGRLFINNVMIRDEYVNELFSGSLENPADINKRSGEILLITNSKTSADFIELVNQKLQQLGSKAMLVNPAAIELEEEREM